MPARPPVTTLLRRVRSAPWRIYRRPLIFGTLAVGICGLVLVQAAPVPSATVAVLRRDVSVGAVIVPADVAVETRPRKHLPTGAISESPVGRIATTDLVAGEVVVDSRLGRPGASAVSGLLPQNRVGVSVPRDAAPPGVTIGDHLDLVAVSADGPVVVAHAAPVVGADDLALAVAVPSDVGPAVIDAVIGGWLIPMLTNP